MRTHTNDGDDNPKVATVRISDAIVLDAPRRRSDMELDASAATLAVELVPKPRPAS